MGELFIIQIYEVINPCHLHDHLSRLSQLRISFPTPSSIQPALPHSHLPAHSPTPLPLSTPPHHTTSQHQPLTQHNPIPNHPHKPHQVHQTTHPMQHAKLSVQLHHLFTMRPLVPTLLPIARLLMLALTHDFRGFWPNPDEVDKTCYEHSEEERGRESIAGACDRASSSSCTRRD
jgi:hypothetical protein